MSLSGFNLLQDNITPPDVWDKVYGWVTSAGRIIVIIVEVVVVAAFVARIFIDTETKRLQEELTQREITVQSYTQIESEILELQTKFTNYKAIWDQGSTYNVALVEVLDESPSSASSFDITNSRSQLNLSGLARVSEVQDLESNLKESENFNSVTVDDLETGSEVDRFGRPLTKFSITVSVIPEVLQGREKYLDNETVPADKNQNLTSSSQ